MRKVIIHKPLTPYEREDVERYEKLKKQPNRKINNKYCPIA